MPALLFRSSTPALVGCMLLFGVTYVALYWRIVRFLTPRWLVFRRRNSRFLDEPTEGRTASHID